MEIPIDSFIIVIIIIFLLRLACLFSIFYVAFSSVYFYQVVGELFSVNKTLVLLEESDSFLLFAWYSESDQLP